MNKLSSIGSLVLHSVNNTPLIPITSISIKNYDNTSCTCTWIGGTSTDNTITVNYNYQVLNSNLSNITFNIIGVGSGVLLYNLTNPPWTITITASCSVGSVSNTGVSNGTVHAPSDSPYNPPSNPSLSYTISGTSDVYWADYTSGITNIINGTCSSLNGPYIYVFSAKPTSGLTNNSQLYLTFNNNYGNKTSWTHTLIRDNCLLVSALTCSCSATGKYVFGPAGMISSDYGSTWNYSNFLNSPLGTNSYVTKFVCSSDGSILYACIGTGANNTQSIYSSISPFTTWTQIASFDIKVQEIKSFALDIYNNNFSVNYLGGGSPPNYYLGCCSATPGSTIASSLYSTYGATSGFATYYLPSKSAHSVDANSSNIGIGVFHSGQLTYSQSGFIYSTNGGSTSNIYPDTTVQDVTISQNGQIWIAVGSSGIKYNSNGFSGTLNQGSVTVTSLKTISIIPYTNLYVACSANSIYTGTWY